MDAHKDSTILDLIRNMELTDIYSRFIDEVLRINSDQAEVSYK